MELIPMRGDAYDRYEALLLERDEYEKEADQLQMEYMRLFGDILTETYQKNIDCIRFKKLIAACIRCRNRGEEPDMQAIRDSVEGELTVYYEDLKRLLAQREAAASGKPISNAAAGQVRRIYHRIAKLLHPDLNPFTEQNEKLMELFRRAVTAYKCNDLKEITELEVLTHQALRDLGIAQLDGDPDIPDIEEKIADLENEIRSIIENKPYTYRTLLNDPEAVSAHEAELRKTLTETHAYAKYLKTELDTLTGGRYDFE